MNYDHRTLTALFYISCLCVHLVSSDEYSELMKRAMRVRVLPLRIDINSTEIDGGVDCRLTLHKDSCTTPSLNQTDAIYWSTKICFQWKCDVAEHAMKVKNCWIGTLKNPVYLIRENGCTQESALLRSPSYLSFSHAISLGWLTVRELGMTHIHIQCDVTLCHVCDESCRRTTPPRSCPDDGVPIRDYDAMWNNSRLVEDLCRNEEEIDVSSLNITFFDLNIVVLITFSIVVRVFW